jgi:tetratricopeptide (TPR) repeat protein
VRRALDLDPGSDWGWDLLRAWSRELGQPGLAAKTARALTERRAGEAQSWLILADTLAGPADLSERLLALERAAALEPRLVVIHDRRAQLLAEDGRFEEARAACRPAAFGDALPPELQGRAAWVEAMSGDTDGAIRQMQAVVRDSPEYYWGWSRLADWCHDSGRKEEGIQAAERLTQIAPNSPVSWGFLAQASEMIGDRAAAREHLLRAVALNASYEYAGLRLFDLAVEDGDLGVAAEALTRLKAHVGGGQVTARAVVLAAGRGDVTGALRELRELCLSAEEDFEAFEMALASLQRAQAGREAELALRRLVRDPQTNPHAGRLWVDASVARRSSVVCAWRLTRLRSEGRASREAACRFVEVLGAEGRKRFLQVFVAWNRRWLRADTKVWGAVGSAFVKVRCNLQAARWLADWRERPDAEPWMLQLLVMALRAAGYYAEAAAVAMRLVEMGPKQRRWVFDKTGWHTWDLSSVR